MQSDPEGIAARTAVIPTGMSVFGVIVSPGIASLDSGLMAQMPPAFRLALCRSQ